MADLENPNNKTANYTAIAEVALNLKDIRNSIDAVPMTDLVTL